MNSYKGHFITILRGFLLITSIYSIASTVVETSAFLAFLGGSSAMLSVALHRLEHV